jgi:DNA (cytosine-5)-methyltransferase 1
MAQTTMSLDEKIEIHRQLKMLDCFCGMGGVSDGYAMEGFDVTGIDIVDAPKMLDYKHKFVQADMMMLKGEVFRGFDVVWGSPPCRDFSEFVRCYGQTWKKNPPNVEKGLKLINHFLEFVDRALPRLWILENVKGLQKYLPLKPQVVTYLTVRSNNQGKKHVFYGNFPPFLIPKDTQHVITYHKVINGQRWPKSLYTKKASWINAKIPLACSRAFAKACKEALEK